MTIKISLKPTLEKKKNNLTKVDPNSSSTLSYKHLINPAHNISEPEYSQALNQKNK